MAIPTAAPSAPAAPAPAKKEPASAPAAQAKKSNAPRGGKYPSRGGGRPRDAAPADEPAEDGGRRKCAYYISDFYRSVC